MSRKKLMAPLSKFSLCFVSFCGERRGCSAFTLLAGVIRGCGLAKPQSAMMFTSSKEL